MTRRTGLPAWWPNALMLAGGFVIGTGLTLRQHGHGPWWLAVLLLVTGSSMTVPEWLIIARTVIRLRRLRRGLFCSACLSTSADLGSDGHGWLCADEAACLARCARRRRSEVL